MSCVYSLFKIQLLENFKLALAGVAQWTEHQP